VTPDCETKSTNEIVPMAFARILDNLPLQKSPLLRRFEDLISPKSDEELEALTQQSHRSA